MYEYVSRGYAYVIENLPTYVLGCQPYLGPSKIMLVDRVGYRFAHVGVGCQLSDLIIIKGRLLSLSSFGYSAEPLDESTKL